MMPVLKKKQLLPLMMMNKNLNFLDLMLLKCLNLINFWCQFAEMTSKNVISKTKKILNPTLPSPPRAVLSFKLKLPSLNRKKSLTNKLRFSDINKSNSWQRNLFHSLNFPPPLPPNPSLNKPSHLMDLLKMMSLKPWKSLIKLERWRNKRKQQPKWDIKKLFTQLLPPNPSKPKEWKPLPRLNKIMISGWRNTLKDQKEPEKWTLKSEIKDSKDISLITMNF